jgi:CBS domain-containing protein
MCGIVTDRDIVVRALAGHRNPADTRLKDICSRDVVTVTPSTSTDEAVRIMREKSVRRLPVLDYDQPVGIVSLGDLAVEHDPKSALADISVAPPNR